MRQLTDTSGLGSIAAGMEFMCSTVGRRLAGSPEEERVADYMIDRFRELGLSQTAKLPFACKRWHPGSAELIAFADKGGGKGEPSEIARLSVQQVTHTPATPAGGVEGELAFLEPVEWENGLKRNDLDGKIGLIWGPYGESADAFSELHCSGLQALLFVNTRLQTDWAPADGVGEKFMGLIRKPMAYVSLMDAWALARDGASRARFTCTGRQKEATSWNAVGEFQGEDPQGAIIVLCGHIDSVSVGVGADDNASGIAAVLECARRLSRQAPRHTFRFIGFGAEEQLSIGSDRYVKEQVEDLERIGFVCNFDGIGAHMGLSTVMCTGTPELDSYVRDTIEDRLLFGQVTPDVSPYQDQFWFTANGIPGIWMTRKTHLSGYWYHHSVHNDLDAVSMEQIAWTAEAACEIVGDLGTSTEWPFPREICRELREKIDRYVKEIF